MKKLSLLAIALLGVAVPVFGQTKPAAKAPTELKCAVQGHKTNIADAVKKGMFVDYKGRRYVFCCAGCKPEFQKNPAKYAKAESIPAPAKKKS